MVRLEITLEAYEAIRETLPKRAQLVPLERAGQGKVYVWLDAKVVAELARFRGRTESFSEVILRLAAAEKKT